MNKRLVIMFAAIAAVAVIVVVCCVLFTVGGVEVKAVTGLELTDEQVSGIVAASDISGGGSIFAVDESAAIAAIEKAYPTLGVVTIERVFPRGVIIKIMRRVGVVAVKIADEEHYAVVDRDLKIVSFAYKDELGSLSLVEGYSVSGTDEELLGAFLNKERAGWLEEVIDGAEQCYLTEDRLGEFAPNIRYFPAQEGEGAGNVVVSTQSGCDLDIPLDSDVSEMFVAAYALLDARLEGGQSVQGTIRFDGSWSFVPAG